MGDNREPPKAVLACREENLMLGTITVVAKLVDGDDFRSSRWKP
jgi:hypothetical protein